jgi:cobalt-zinc-cadmium resistance protein CzcA
MISHVLALSIQHRWVVVLLSLGAVVLGLWSLIRLPIDAVPDITNKQVQVNTTAPALSPVEIEKQVTFRIETALAGIPGLDNTRSISRNGFSQVTAVFSEKTDIYFARQQVGERLLELRPNLPRGVEPKMGPISTGLGEIYMWSIGFAPRGADAGAYVTPEGDRLDTEVERAAYLRTVQDWMVRPQVKSVVGVAGVDSIGGYVKQYQVQPDPLKLISLGLSFGDVARAIEANNVSRGASVIERNGEGIAVRTGGRLETLADIGDVVISTRGSVPVRVRDVAQVAIGGEIRTGSASENGHEVVVGTALMLIGSNSRTVAAAVDAKIEQVRRTLPAGIEIQTVLNRTQLVDSTVSTVATNLGEGALLVILVLFLLLGNFRAALITALVIPVAMLMTATGMLQGRISANLMSLGALDFGLIVDGAVIIAENTLRHLAERQAASGRPLSISARLQTVRAAAEEMIGPSAYGQAIIIIVYVPLLTFGGVEGKMFEPMALTVILALGAAFVLSLTFVPANRSQTS